MMSISEKFYSPKITTGILLLFFAIAAGAEDNKRSPVDKSYRHDPDLQLGIIGYNYTDREIDLYSVDGSSGGSIRLSSPGSGGSGITCCMSLPRKISRDTKVTVRWQVDGCRYTLKSDLTGAVETLRHLFYKEIEVPVSRKPGTEVSYLETHFYPDGSVRVYATEEPSLPHYSLSDRRKNKSSFPRCKDGKKPE